MSHRVAVISDIHGNNIALEAVLDDIKQANVENIIVAGDSTGIPDQNKVYRTLTDEKALLIRGNGEKRIVSKNRGHIAEKIWNQTSYQGNRWVYNDIDPSIMNFLEFLPDQRIVEFDSASTFLVVHGSPKDNYTAQGILPEQSSPDSKKLMAVHSTISIDDAVEGLQEKILICGHTHRPWVHSVNDILVVNPGSVGNPCNGDPRSDYAILEWDKDQWVVEPRMVDYDLQSVSDQFHEGSYLEKIGVFARLTMLCRLTGLDVNLDFLFYVKTLMGQERMSYEEAYTAASNSFDWQKYT